MNQRGHSRCSIGFSPQTPDDNPPSYRSHSEPNGILITVGGWSKNGEYQEQMEFCAPSSQKREGEQENVWLKPTRAVLGTPVERQEKKKVFFYFFF